MLHGFVSGAAQVAADEHVLAWMRGLIGLGPEGRGRVGPAAESAA
jgi:hypothetical protein